MAKREGERFVHRTTILVVCVQPHEAGFGASRANFITRYHVYRLQSYMWTEQPFDWQNRKDRGGTHAELQ
jgi:hypothetical protein